MHFNVKINSNLFCNSSIKGNKNLFAQVSTNEKFKNDSTEQPVSSTASGSNLNVQKQTLEHFVLNFLLFRNENFKVRKLWDWTTCISNIWFYCKVFHSIPAERMFTDIFLVTIGYFDGKEIPCLIQSYDKFSIRLIDDTFWMRKGILLHGVT